MPEEQKPSAGRIVRYTTQGNEHAAMILGVVVKDGETLVGLEVFPNPYVCRVSGNWVVKDIAYSEEPRDNTWRWTPRA